MAVVTEDGEITKLGVGLQLHLVPFTSVYESGREGHQTYTHDCWLSRMKANSETMVWEDIRLIVAKTLIAAAPFMLLF
jgi:hypothetical protein